MSYPNSDLTFKALRAANTARLPQFRDAKGRLSHGPKSKPWSLSDWMTALAGEVGEAANLVKKVRRGDFTLDEAREKIADELADVVIYVDLLAKAARIDLASAVERKFNVVSRRVSADVFLAGGDWSPFDPALPVNPIRPPKR